MQSQGIHPYKEGYQQRKLPKNTGKSPVFRKRNFLGVMVAANGAAGNVLNKSIIKPAWTGLIVTCGFTSSEDDTVKSSVTLLKLNSL